MDSISTSYQHPLGSPQGLRYADCRVFGGKLLAKILAACILPPTIPRDWYSIAERPAPAPHLAHPEGCAALRIVLLTAPRVSCYFENFPDRFDLHLLPTSPDHRKGLGMPTGGSSGGSFPISEAHVYRGYRGTSLTRKCPPHSGNHMSLGTVLL